MTNPFAARRRKPSTGGAAATPTAPPPAPPSRLVLPSRPHLDDMRKADLQVLAASRGVQHDSGDTRAELIDALERDAGRHS